MYKKLRRKIVIYTILGVFSILAIILGTVNIVNFISSAEGADHVTERIAANKGKMNPGGGPGGHGGPGGRGFDGGGMGGGTSAEKADDSAKAIKAVEAINISAGKIFSYTYDDCIHTNGDPLDTGKTGSATITISGGEFTLKASDDAAHADGTLNITGGTINVAQSHEAIEGKILNSVEEKLLLMVVTTVLMVLTQLTLVVAT